MWRSEGGGFWGGRRGGFGGRKGEGRRGRLCPSSASGTEAERVVRLRDGLAETFDEGGGTSTCQLAGFGGAVGFSVRWDGR